jgi:thioredoxin-like negative regulator of GroEL
MKHFWEGFEATKSAAPVRFKKHVLVLYWSSDNDKSTTAKNAFHKISIKHPSVAIKTVDARKDPTLPLKHKIMDLPTVVLLKDGREVERLSLGKDGTLLEHLFRRAGV